MNAIIRHPDSRLDRIKPALACPACRGELSFEPDRALCAACDEAYPIRGGKVYFVQVPERTDQLDKLKGFCKRLLGRYYHSIGINLIAPVYPFGYARRVRRHLDPARQLVLNLGCGTHRIDENMIGVDLFDYDAVDVVCDLRALPFKSESIDAMVSVSVLEHVPDPRVVVAECDRCTKRGGIGMHLLPFLYPFHASPFDFHRFTHQGQQVLLDGWETVEQTNAAGPVTLMLICLIEFLSIVLSLGHEKLKAFINLLLCGLLFPVKFLDFPFINRKAFLTLAPTIFIVGRKP
ncbi:MAG: methyltransferase domain-containing protein [Phycisphaerae bacterium]